jgi:hypothetical protein
MRIKGDPTGIKRGLLLLVIWLGALAWPWVDAAATQNTVVVTQHAVTLPPSCCGEVRSYVIASGTLAAGDAEMHDGYFGIAQRTAVMVTPDSPGWLHLKELRGSRVSLIVRVDP